jgi:hypothetical protein
MLLLYFMPYFMAGKLTENDLHACANKKGA